MGASSGLIVFPPGNSGKVSKWKVKEGAFVSVGRVLLLYDINTGSGQPEQKKLKATQDGMVRKLLAKEGEIVQPGMAILELEECTHPTVMNAMCAECGADLKKEDNQSLTASVPMVHSIPELKVSKEQAELLGKADEDRLLQEKKLVLLVDLDQTLIHTTNDNIPPNLKDVYHFQLYGPHSPWYHTRIRPGTQKFLSEVSQCYELHICTFGARNYAHMIAMFLDPDGRYFSHRILSRDECFNPNSKTANLKALFPLGDNMVCIIDDREDVWNFAPNLIHVKPYHFFQHTGDINAPPGLAKCENDDKEGFDFSKLGGEGKKPNSKEKLVNNISKAEDKIKDTSEQQKEKKEVTSKVDSCSQKGGVKDDEGKKDVEVKQDVEVKRDAEVNKVIVMKNEEMKNDAEMKNVAEMKKDVEVKKDQVKDEDKNTTKTKSPDKEKEVKDEKVKIMESENKTEEKERNDTVVSVKDDLNITDDESETGKLGLVEQKESGCDNDRTAKNGDGKSKKGDSEDLIEIEDSDDYLLYLEEILKRIHHTFYDLYDEEQKDIPDLKSVIPYVRRKVLEGTHLVFSGLVPTNVELEKSRVYQVAISLGARVTQDITPQTTHLVAVRPGTAKVNIARRMKNIFIVTPEWLWCCAERWDHVNELLYPVKRTGALNRHPPPHCGSPEPKPETYAVHQQPAVRRRTPSGRFMDTINPLMSFSPEDIASMDREVEDIFNESESEGDDEVKATVPPKDEDSSTSCSTDSLSGAHPHGWHEERKRRRSSNTDSDDLEEDSPVVKFRRGEDLPSDLDLGDNDDASNDGSEEPPDEVDDGEWNMMGAALEREFLSGE